MKSFSGRLKTIYSSIVYVMTLIMLLAGCFVTARVPVEPPANEIAGSRIAIDGAPNGLVFDEESKRLFIVDSANHRVLVRDESGEITELCAVEPPAGQRQLIGLGGVTLDGAGNLYLVRLPFKERNYGAIFKIDIASGAVTEMANIDKRWRRVGLAYDSEEKTLYVATFDKLGQGIYNGWIAAVDPVVGNESVIVEGFQKPVGIIKIGRNLLVTDQKTGEVIEIDLSGAAPVKKVLIEGLPEPDLMTGAGDNFFFTAYDAENNTGYIYRFDRGGNYELLQKGPWQPRGIAFDSRGTLFVSLYKRGVVLALPVSAPGTE
jgi:sugar lactone lactonase YvrE